MAIEVAFQILGLDCNKDFSNKNIEIIKFNNDNSDSDDFVPHNKKKTNPVPFASTPLLPKDVVNVPSPSQDLLPPGQVQNNLSLQTPEVFSDNIEMFQFGTEMVHTSPIRDPSSPSMMEIPQEHSEIFVPVPSSPLANIADADPSPLIPVLKNWIDHGKELTLSEYYSNLYLLFQVMAICDSEIQDKKCLRISDGHCWINALVDDSYQDFISNNIIKEGDIIKILSTSGSPKGHNFKLVLHSFLLFIRVSCIFVFRRLFASLSLYSCHLIGLWVTL